MPSDNEIHWPPEFVSAPVYVSNEIVIDATPAALWTWLIRAECWPEWYKNSSKVQFISPPGPNLQDGTKFRWKTFKSRMTSQVREFVPEERLAWNARGRGTWAYHAWLIQKVDGGCRVLTEEKQYGLLCQLQDVFCPNRMHKGHQEWLEGLQRMVKKDVNAAC